MNDITKEIEDRIITILKDLTVDCPACEGCYDDEQYTCTTCWCEGGNGKLRVEEYVKIIE
jgi:hypothetical protein